MRKYSWHINHSTCKEKSTNIHGGYGRKQQGNECSRHPFVLIEAKKVQNKQIEKIYLVQFAARSYSDLARLVVWLVLFYSLWLNDLFVWLVLLFYINCYPCFMKALLIIRIHHSSWFFICHICLFIFLSNKKVLLILGFWSMSN